MFSKYIFNQILAIISIVIFIGVFVWLSTLGNINIWQSIYAMIVLVITEHYLLNLIHIASHRSLSKNYFVNEFFGNLIAILTGISLPVFRETHNLHHANTNNPERDPDHFISTSGHLWWIAGRIFYHDYYFFKNGLFKRKNNLITYLIDRLAQISLVLVFQFTNNLNVWIYYWLPSILIIGSMYGFYQFYFPHYSTKFVDSLRSKPLKNIFQRFALFTVDFSRYYHYKHHEQIKNNTYYFPFYTYLNEKFILKKSLGKQLGEIKY